MAGCWVTICLADQGIDVPSTALVLSAPQGGSHSAVWPCQPLAACAGTSIHSLLPAGSPAAAWHHCGKSYIVLGCDLMQDRQQRQQKQPTADANGGQAGGVDVEARIAAAVSEAKAAAEAEAGEEMEDLLACLGRS